MAGAALHDYSEEKELMPNDFCSVAGETEGMTIAASGNYGFRHENWPETYPVASAVAPFIVPSQSITKNGAARDHLSNKTSMGIVLDDIRRAPFAYFRFATLVSFLLFVLSLSLYLSFHVLLLNPIFAVFGAIGSLLTALLVQASLIVEGKKSSPER